MAAAEPLDYLDYVGCDYNYTLTISAQGKITEEGRKNQIIRHGDDNTRGAVTITTGSRFFVSWNWNILTEADSGTILDLYHDATKANGMGKSFLWSGHDGHTYTVAFDCKLNRVGGLVSAWGLPGVRLEILGHHGNCSVSGNVDALVISGKSASVDLDVGVSASKVALTTTTYDPKINSPIPASKAALTITTYGATVGVP